jgi:hypothetical protein
MPEIPSIDALREKTRSLSEQFQATEQQRREKLDRMNHCRLAVSDLDRAISQMCPTPREGEPFQWVDSPSPFHKEVDVTLARTFRLLKEAGLARELQRINRDITRSWYYPAEARLDRQADDVAGELAYRLIEEGLQSGDHKDTRDLVTESYEDPALIHSRDWLLLLLFGLVDAVWVPRVVGDTTGNGEAEEVAAPYPVFTGMRNVLTFARDCYQLARDPEDPKSPAEDRETLALNKFLAVGPHFVTLANAPTSQWHSLDAWAFLRDFAQLLRSSRAAPPWVTAWGRIRKELKQQETLLDFDHFFLEINENLTRLLPSTGAPAPFYLPLQTVSSLNVDPRFALEQICAKSTEQEEAVVAEQPEAGRGSTGAGRGQVEARPPEGAGAAHEKAGSEQTESAAGNPDGGLGLNWLTVTRAARIAGCNRGAITRAVNEGKLKSNGEKGRDRRVDAVDLTRWMDARANRVEPVESDAAVERKFQQTTPNRRRSNF